jgi:heme-degrading monooxygenase HmoA
MIHRIVQLRFRAEATTEFTAIYQASNERIRAFPGCRHLELWRDRDDPRRFFTYSRWESEAALEAYRHSDLFRATWAKTKVLFSDRPLVYSLDGFGNNPE